MHRRGRSDEHGQARDAGRGGHGAGGKEVTATLDLGTVYRTPLGLQCRVVLARGHVATLGGDVKLVYLPDQGQVSGEVFSLTRENVCILTPARGDG